MFCFFYIVHGILKERYHEIAVFIISTILLAAYLIINVASTSQTDHKPLLKQVRLGVALAFLLPIVYLGGKVARTYRQERKLLYRINAKQDLQSMLNWLFLCSSLIMFDLQLQVRSSPVPLPRGEDLARPLALLCLLESA